MNERSLRDELERLQVETKGLEHELTLEHAPRFLAQRDELRAQLRAERERLNELERRGSDADRGFVELSSRVEALKSRLRALEQRRLGVLPLLLLFALAAAGLTVFTPELRFDVLGACGAAILGLLFGPRLFAWATGRRVALPAEASRPAFSSSRAMMSMVFGGGFGAFALIGGYTHAVMLWDWEVKPGIFIISAFTQAAAIPALVLALRVFRLNRTLDRAAAASGLVLASLALVVLGLVSVSWMPEVLASPPSVELVFVGLAGFAPLLPAVGLIVLAVRPEVKRAWPLVASLACAVMSVGITAITFRERHPVLELEDFAQGWAGLLLALMGAALAKRRWLGVAAGVLAAGVATFWLVSRA